MAGISIIHFVNAPKGQSRDGMAGVMRYAEGEEKTMWKGQRLVSGYNCRPESVYDDFMRTKLLYHKADGRMYYHMVQSFPKDAQVDPVQAHAAALKLAEWFKDREVLVCTHIDREHIHSHFVINSVSLEDGKKLHIADPELEELKKLNDQICLEFGLPVFQPQEKKRRKTVSNAEYHSAVKGESWKFRLMNTIDSCMKYAGNRDEFISLMRGEGYDVKWTDTRKNITYTTPEGKKCRDTKLHDEKYGKEVMEREFRIRQEIIAGGAEAVESAAGTAAGDAGYGTHRGGDTSHCRGVGRTVGLHQRSVQSDDGDIRLDETAVGERGAGQHGEAAGGTDAGSEAGQRDAGTGWEEERAAFLNSQDHASPHTAASPGRVRVVLSADSAASLGSALVELGKTLERSGDDTPVRDSTTMPGHADRKTLAREREKKIAMGHKPDDHEDQPTWQQTM